MSNSNQTRHKFTRRHLKVYRGFYQVGYRKHLKPHPIIRLGGNYLENLGFQVGDSIEVRTEQERIVITKLNPTLFD